MVSGETHYFQGRRYRLSVVRVNRDGVHISKAGTIQLNTHDGIGVDKRFEILQKWYRTALQQRMGPLIEKWEPIVGVDVRDWRIRRMKTRWGTCNQDERRIWVNLELAKKPPESLEYIIVHEMVHLLERNHGGKFVGIMNRVLPKWRLLRDSLNQAPLRHENWNY